METAKNKSTIVKSAMPNLFFILLINRSPSLAVLAKFANPFTEWQLPSRRQSGIGARQ
jgi:hypothetical protein